MTKEQLIKQTIDLKEIEDMSDPEGYLLRTLIDTIPELVFAKDVEGKFIVSNMSHARVLGEKEPCEVLGKTDSDCFSADIADHCGADDMEIIRTGKPWFDREEVIYDQTSNEKKWCSTTKVPLRDHENNIIGLVGICRDITKRKTIEAELDLFREKMIRAEQLASLGTASAVMAHELSQPLTIIRLSLQQALRKLNKLECPESVISKLTNCVSEISNASTIIDRFRNFTRRQDKEVMEDLDVLEVTRLIIQILDESARRAKIRLIISEIDGLPLISMNRSDIEQILFVLIQNSIQAADGKKWRSLNINAQVQNDTMCMSFSDNCCGIKPENVEKVFEPFFTTKPLGQGTGLGLSIIRDIISGYGGKITAWFKIGCFGVTVVEEWACHCGSMVMV